VISDDELCKALRHRAGLPETCATDAYVMLQAEQRIKLRPLDELDASRGEAQAPKPTTADTEEAKLVSFFNEPAAYSRWGWEGDKLLLSPAETAIRALRALLVPPPHGDAK
jgi:hypothetical protein